MLVRVVAPDFVAGLIMEGDRCTKAAPILAKRAGALGKTREELREVFKRKGWKASIVP